MSSTLMTTTVVSDGIAGSSEPCPSRVRRAGRMEVVGVILAVFEVVWIARVFVGALELSLRERGIMSKRCW